jgi:hypothetical protein
MSKIPFISSGRASLMASSGVVGRGGGGDLPHVEIFYTLQEARILVETWRREYNTIRPHSSLGGRPPAPETMAWVPPEAMPPHASEVVLH